MIILSGVLQTLEKNIHDLARLQELPVIEEA